MLDESAALPDGTLIDRSLRGDAAAYGQLVRKHQDRLHHSITHLLGSADEACDVVQDAFVQAFVKLESFARTAAFYTWLYRIAVNLALSRRRRAKHHASLDHLRETTNHEPTDCGAAPDGQLLQQEQVERVQRALAALSDDYRVVVVMREMDELSYEEIAAILDVPVGTVRSRLSRARDRLRELLKETNEAKTSTVKL